MLWTKRKWRKFATLLVLPAAMFLTTGCQSSESQVSQARKLATIHQTVAISHYDLTVNKVQINKIGLGTLKPNPGNEYLILTLTVKNRGHKPHKIVSQRMFRLLGPRGNFYNVSQFTHALNSKIDRTLQPGSQEVAKVAYQIPKHDHRLRFIYADSSLTFGKVIIDLGV